MSLTFTDIFCGAGGSSTGLVAAGMELKLAANHWAKAIETHAANHPNAEHVCADINNYDMRRLPTTRVLWGSPICTESTPAGGKKRPPTRGQLALLKHGPVADAAWERTRATAYDIIRATEVHRYDAVLCENVVEFATDWELFGWWRNGMELLGYNSQITSVSSAHIGGPGNLHAPQWRDRIYIVFTRAGIPLPDLRPTPLARCKQCDQDIPAVQSWRNGRTIGKYKQQYDYRCPNTACGHAFVEPYIRPAADIIDWTNRGRRIGDRRRPLVENTLARIRAGLAAHSTTDEGLLVPCGGGWNDSPTSTADPMRTRMANPKGFEALFAPPNIQPRRSTPPRNHGLVIPYRKALPKTTAEPIHTISTVDSAALVQGGPQLEDCYFRMVQPREQLLAQRFPADYIVHGNQGEQTMQAGNAVSANVAQWIGQRVAAVLA
ncbi:DNA methyltransferase [Embleya scabrispora]|uniref:DNA (cytosine-5-)-methyltransferase n=1 Tax=Embleya scabrispora TaxID=159449 RepID=A0A1T3P583_9ACTN|nr:DNA cytosine methyltransferase [Embleya scabrispora]OPC84152.1 DNA methyltransferase [Embleya scabrispora]